MKLIQLDSIDSTNQYIKDNYQTLDDLSLVVAKKQTGGKGRGNRKWFSEDDKNLLMSVLIKNNDLLENYQSLSILSAYSVIEILNKYGIKAKIKWPNDVFVNDKKICGILLEAIAKEKIECLVIGMGLNVNQKEFVEDYLIEPTSLIRETNKESDLKVLMLEIYQQLIDNFEKLSIGYDFYQEISALNYLENKEAYALINNKKQLVKVMGINRDYSLSIQLDNQRLNIEAGEISFHI